MNLQTVKDFLRVDGTAEDNLINTLIKDAEDYLTDSIEGYSTKISNPRFARKADSLKLLIISDAYNNRSMVTETVEKLRYAAQSLLCQLQYGTFV